LHFNCREQFLRNPQTAPISGYFAPDAGVPSPGLRHVVTGNGLDSGFPGPNDDDLPVEIEISAVAAWLNYPEPNTSVNFRRGTPNAMAKVWFMQVLMTPTKPSRLLSDLDWN